MLSKSLLQFLRDLKENNYKEWFHENKPRYQKVKKEFEQFVAHTIADIAQFDNSVKHLEPKHCIFRINRDIRFSNDKSPYKTNFGGFIVPGGKNAGYAGYYIHIEPGNCFLAGGIYMPPPDRLKAVRNEIFENTADFKKILSDKNFKKHFSEISSENKLKTAPKGFPKDFKDIDLLRHKHYTVLKYIDEELVTSDKFVDKVRETFMALYPFNSFINEAINYQLSID
ncbi:MAG: TIGR02453 family protein [Marinilabiliales bacterium]|nr:MAG: TIGR02453 family protein [Marinilabiliales bacterium]